MGDGEPLGSYDDVLNLGDYVFAAVENSVAAFDATATSWDDPVDVAQPGGVLLSGFAVGGTPRLILASGLADGTRFYNWNSTTNSFYFAGSHKVDGTRTYGQYLLGPDDSPDGTPWLFIVYSGDDATKQDACAGLSEPNSSIRVYRLNVNGHGAYLPTQIDYIGGWIVQACDAATGNLLTCHVEPAGGDTLAVWANYAPRVNATGIAETTAGLLALKAEWDEQTDVVAFTFLGKEPAYTSPSIDAPAHVDFDGSRVYVAFGCDGIAAFDTTGGVLAVPTLDSAWESDIEGSSILKVIPGPGTYVYAADLSGHLRVFDRDDLSLGPVRSEPTRGQATSLQLRSGGTARFYVTDSRAGLHVVEFGSVP